MSSNSNWCKIAFAALNSRSVESFYDSIASIYDDVFTTHKAHVKQMVEILNEHRARPIDNLPVLDLSCGTGMMSSLLKAQGYRVIGIDFSCRSLSRYQEKIPFPELLQADAHSLPLRSSSLHAVVCLGSWRHYIHLRTVSKEISRVLQPDGVFIVGYFPPALAGTVNIKRNKVNSGICMLYRLVTKMLGFCDRTDFSLLTETQKLLEEYFREVKRVDSNMTKQLLYATALRT